MVDPGADLAGTRPSPSAHLRKRLFDILVAAIALCLCSPLLLVLALVVALSAGRPLLYREYRVGRRGVLFPQYKFRTLRPDSSGLRTVAPEDDPRIVGAGRWLRRWRLDELPQLLNVLWGHMSLVGPRPMPRSHADRLPPVQRNIILSVRPGLTDDAALFFLAEDAALAGRPDPEALYLERLFPAKARMQVDSLARWSLRDDLRILRQTLASLWSPAARAESARAMQELLAGCPPAN